MSKLSAPRHGSLGFSPRKRAKRAYGSVSVAGPIEGTQAIAFPGYKAGMTQINTIDKYQHSPSFEKKVSVPATIIECPPITVFCVRAYKKTQSGLKCIGDIWSEKKSKHLARKTKTPKTKPKEPDFSSASEIRLLVHTNPPHKKTPDVFEIPVNGNAEEALAYAKGLLGKEIKVSDILATGEFVDTIAITKGKGWQGPVKRFGARIQYRKATGKRRHVGSISPWSPSRNTWRALQPGQMGYNKRTALNQLVLQMGDNGEEITPKGGLVKYGEVKNDYVLVKGSVPGPKKRLVIIRVAVRPPKKKQSYEIKKVRQKSQQGRAKK